MWQVGIQWNIFLSAYLPLKPTTLPLRVNYWAAFLPCNVGIHIWLGSNLSCWLITNLSSICKLNLVCLSSRLVGLMLCFLGMSHLFILLGNPILLLMLYPATQLLFLWIRLLLLESFLPFLVIFMLGITPFFCRGWCQLKVKVKTLLLLQLVYWLRGSKEPLPYKMSCLYSWWVTNGLWFYPMMLLSCRK